MHKNVRIRLFEITFLTHSQTVWLRVTVFGFVIKRDET